MLSPTVAKPSSGADSSMNKAAIPVVDNIEAGQARTEDICVWVFTKLVRKHFKRRSRALENSAASLCLDEERY